MAIFDKTFTDSGLRLRKFFKTVTSVSDFVILNKYSASNNEYSSFVLSILVAIMASLIALSFLKIFQYNFALSAKSFALKGFLRICLLKDSILTLSLIFSLFFSLETLQE